MAALSATAQAAVTNVAWYSLGEIDSGGISGMAVTNTTMDAVGTKHLKQYGSPLYTNAVSAGASNRVGSLLAVHFNGTSQYLSNAVVSTAVNNFGMEAWVKPNTTNAAAVTRRNPNADMRTNTPSWRNGQNNDGLFRRFYASRSV